MSKIHAYREELLYNDRKNLLIGWRPPRKQTL